MTITQLEYIVAVDTYRSFVLAAEKCFVADVKCRSSVVRGDIVGIRWKTACS